MINLLPPKYKKELAQEKTLKLIIIWGFIFVFFLACLLLLLFSTKIFIGGESEVQKIILEQRENEFQNSQSGFLQKRKSDYGDLLSNVENFYKERYEFIGLVEEISSLVPEGVGVSGILLNLVEKKEDSSANCRMFGVSLTQEKLINLRENLEKDERFEDIKIPLSNWLESENIEFSVTFSASQEDYEN